MKPNWKDAPASAKWLAMDADGTWWWFENQPYTGNGEWDDPVGMPDFAGQEAITWRDTLEKRP